MKLTGEIIRELADFADGAECKIVNDGKYALAGEILSAVLVTRKEDGESIRIFENGMVENGKVSHGA